MVDVNAEYDPYALPPEAILEPPKSLWQALRKIGPGIILAGTIVGSGELILTTAIGAKHGFTFLWLVLFSCVIKVFVQVELGRYVISTGKPTLGALQQISSYRAIGNFLLVWWFLMMICTAACHDILDKSARVLATFLSLEAREVALRVWKITNAVVISSDSSGFWLQVQSFSETHAEV
ncbi:MAG: Nramp family divalent metal transporter [Planctomycetota bacterium]|nr:Nramp family divalent metal transporter [Planctomycetota bacterium]